MHVRQDKGFGFVVMFGQGLGFGLTSLTCCCRTQIGIWLAMALNWVELCRNLLKGCNLFLIFLQLYLFSIIMESKQFPKLKVDFSLRREIMIAFSCHCTIPSLEP